MVKSSSSAGATAATLSCCWTFADCFEVGRSRFVAELVISSAWLAFAIKRSRHVYLWEESDGLFEVAQPMAARQAFIPLLRLFRRKKRSVADHHAPYPPRRMRCAAASSFDASNCLSLLKLEDKHFHRDVPEISRLGV